MKNRKNSVLPFPEPPENMRFAPRPIDLDFPAIISLMKSSIIEIYKCATLTIISVLLSFILWRMAERPMTVYVEGGNIDVDNEVGVEIVDPLPVEVQNVVDVSVQ